MAATISSWPGCRANRRPSSPTTRQSTLNPGDLLVLQVHYHIGEDPPPDQSALALQFGDGDPSDYDDIEVTTYVAPAEIPCEPEATAPPV